MQCLPSFNKMLHIMLADMIQQELFIQFDWTGTWEYFGEKVLILLTKPLGMYSVGNIIINMSIFHKYMSISINHAIVALSLLILSSKLNHFHPKNSPKTPNTRTCTILHSALHSKLNCSQILINQYWFMYSDLHQNQYMLYIKVIARFKCV